MANWRCQERGDDEKWGTGWRTNQLLHMRGTEGKWSPLPLSCASPRLTTACLRQCCHGFSRVAPAKTPGSHLWCENASFSPSLGLKLTLDSYHLRLQSTRRSLHLSPRPPSKSALLSLWSRPAGLVHPPLLAGTLKPKFSAP